MSEQEQKQALYKHMWDMQNSLRGSMDGNEFKYYILGIMFYRYISDRTEQFLEKHLLDGEGKVIDYSYAWTNEENRGIIRKMLLSNLGYVIEPSDLYSSIANGAAIVSNNLIEDLHTAIRNIESSTQGQDSEKAFEGIFDIMDLNSIKLGADVGIRTRIIASVIKGIDGLLSDFRYEDATIDIFGDVYEYLIGEYAANAGKKGGEFYTPAAMSELVAHISTVGLTNIKNVYDPTCGSGGLLRQVGKAIPGTAYDYYGQELNTTTYTLAKMNMIMHGVKYKDFHIVNADTLERPAFEDVKFDVQVANPPYSLTWNPDNHYDDMRFIAGLAPTTKADWAFVQHMIYHMAEDGRIATLLPHGVLSRGNAEKEIRQYIIKNQNVLDAVIGLPANCFYGTNIPVVLLVFKKNRNGNGKNICFIDASKEFISGKNQNSIGEKEISKIVETYTNRVDVEKYCRVVEISEIEDNDYDLNINIYVDSREDAEEIDIIDVKEKIAELEEQRDSIKEELQVFFDELGI